MKMRFSGIWEMREELKILMNSIVSLWMDGSGIVDKIGNLFRYKNEYWESTVGVYLIGLHKINNSPAEI